MIKIILIDVDNTLLDFNKCAEYAMKEACKEKGIEFLENMTSVFHEINNCLWSGIEKGTVTKEQLHNNRWKMIFERLNIDLDGVSFEKTFREYLAKSAEPITGAKELILYLSGKYRVFAASNAFYNQQIKRLTMAGMYENIEGMFISEKIGYEKPSKEFFDECFLQLGNPSKDEVIIIGDSLTADIGGGADYGIKTCWYNPDRKPQPEDFQIDYTVNKLGDILKIL